MPRSENLFGALLEVAFSAFSEKKSFPALNSKGVINRYCCTAPHALWVSIRLRLGRFLDLQICYPRVLAFISDWQSAV